MKKILILIAFLILISACTQQETALDESEQAQTTGETTPAEATTTAGEEEEAEEAPQQDNLAERLAQEQAERIADSLETPPKLEQRDRETFVEQMFKAYSLLESYKFRNAQGSWHVRGEKIKFLPINPIILYNAQKGDKKYKQAYLDELFFDTKEKTLTGYCFGFSESVNRQCATFELYDIPFQLPYEQYITKLPHEWLKDYMTDVPINEEHEKYYVKNIETTRVKFEDGTEIYFFERAGLPLRIVKGYDITNYEDVVNDQVRPEDVTHRSRKDIPPQESYYTNPY